VVEVGSAINKRFFYITKAVLQVPEDGFCIF